MSALRCEGFGKTADGSPVERYLLSDGPVEVGILTWGATVQSVLVPDRRGRTADVVLGFDELAGYLGPHPYFGAIVGRYANRIAGGRFTLDGREYRIPPNDNGNVLHGGAGGFDRRVWSASPVPADGAAAVRLSLVSPDGDLGFPGELRVEVTYTLRGGELRIDYLASTDRPTVVNLTNHAYLNLAGAGSGPVESHELQIAASRFLPVDAGLIPLGRAAGVEGTPMDFRLTKPIGRDIREATEQLMRGRGYDHTWVLDRAAGDPPSLAAHVIEPTAGRWVEVWTDQPGVQFYSGNLLEASVAGKGGRTYRPADGFCLETQAFPDSPNQPSFPSTALRPGERYATTTWWRFGPT